MTEKAKRWLKPAEVAALLCVDRMTVYRWIEKGYIRAIRLPSGRLRIPVEEVERILAEVRR